MTIHISGEHGRFTSFGATIRPVLHDDDLVVNAQAPTDEGDVADGALRARPCLGLLHPNNMEHPGVLLEVGAIEATLVRTEHGQAAVTHPVVTNLVPRAIAILLEQRLPFVHGGLQPVGHGEQARGSVHLQTALSPGGNRVEAVDVVRLGRPQPVHRDRTHRACVTDLGNAPERRCHRTVRRDNMQGASVLPEDRCDVARAAGSFALAIADAEIARLACAAELEGRYVPGAGWIRTRVGAERGVASPADIAAVLRPIRDARVRRLGAVHADRHGGDANALGPAAAEWGVAAVGGHQEHLVVQGHPQGRPHENRALQEGLALELLRGVHAVDVERADLHIEELGLVASACAL
mmetsp:Transcript_46845/g.134961  ORF Transcript_46845/g.134961 Transcript_46845/m.134961 type:complete len:351 (+) Transcript_46845:3746-4798(+)